MRDATEREEQFRQRIQTNNVMETPKDIPPSISTVSSASTLSFHTPAVDQSPNLVAATDHEPMDMSPPSTIEHMDTTNSMSITPIEKAEVINASTKRAFVRHTANEETVQTQYRPGIKLVASNVLKSTIQNYMIDHNPLDESQGK